MSVSTTAKSCISSGIRLALSAGILTLGVISGLTESDFVLSSTMIAAIIISALLPITTIRRVSSAENEVKSILAVLVKTFDKFSWATLILISLLSLADVFILVADTQPEALVGVGMAAVCLIAGHISTYGWPSKTIIQQISNGKVIKPSSVTVADSTRLAGALLFHLNSNSTKAIQFASRESISSLTKGSFWDKDHELDEKAIRWRIMSLMAPSIAESLVFGKAATRSSEESKELLRLYPRFSDINGTEVDPNHLADALDKDCRDFVKENLPLIKELSELIRNESILTPTMLDPYRSKVNERRFVQTTTSVEIAPETQTRLKAV